MKIMTNTEFVDILSIFKLHENLVNRDKKKISLRYTHVWYESILKDLQEFGHNSKGHVNIVPQDFVPRYEKDIKKKYQDYINPLQYSHFYVKHLIEQCFLVYYNEPDNWSHPFILKMLRFLCDNPPIFNHYRNRFPHLCWDFYYFLSDLIKITNRPNSSLRIYNDFSIQDFFDNQSSIVNDLIIKSRCKDKLIVVDINQIVFSCYAGKIHNDFVNHPFIKQRETTGYMSSVLEALCRKHGISVI